jgi:OmpA-OmpF porin, OOP family
MAGGDSRSEQRGGSSYRLPNPGHLGWWAAIAMLLSVLLHVVVYFSLERLKIALKFEQARELSTRPIDVRQVKIQPQEIDPAQTPETEIPVPKDTAALLDEVDLLAKLPKDQEIDLKPEVIKAEYALKMGKPAAEGDSTATALQSTAGFEIDSELPEFGRDPVTIRPAAIGQMIVDPGSPQADDANLAKFTDDLIKRGANGKADNGALDGITSLDDLLGLPANVLLGKKTMLPSDLLFEFNRAELRESAKVGLMKLVLLMDQNPKLFCWIEGHTDLIGGDEANLQLSIKRAEAVQKYLVSSAKMDSSKIVTRGFGRYQPLISEGDRQQQSINRRVEIRMRQALPTDPQIQVTLKKAAIVAEQEDAPANLEEPPPKATLVKPKRALPVEEEPTIGTNPPRATPIEEHQESQNPPAVPRANPVEVQESEPIEEPAQEP